jgi:hypothetical protein
MQNLKFGERLVVAWRVLLGRPMPWEHGPKFQKSKKMAQLPKRDYYGRWIDEE